MDIPLNSLKIVSIIGINRGRGNINLLISPFIRGDIPKEVEKLKKQEFRLKTFPITLGLGKRLFAEGTIPVGLKLLESEISPSGVIIATYLRSGEVKTGSFALEIPTEAELARRKRIKEGK